MTKKLEGTLQLDLCRKGIVVKRVEKKNTITSLFADAILDGDFQHLMNRQNINPESWFNGCLLTDKPNNANISMIAGNSEIVACAGGAGTAYAGSFLKRGNFIEADSHTFTTPTLGFTHTWRWDYSYGNGHIESVCLCPSELGIFDYIDGAMLPALDSDNNRSKDFNPPNKALGYSNVSGYDVEETYLNSIAHLTIIDYANGIGYYVHVSSDSTILIDEYAIATSRVRVLSNPDYVLQRLGTTHTISLATALPRDTGWGDRWFTLCYTGDTFHIIAITHFTENNIEKATLRDIAIAKSDMSTYTETYHTYSNVWLYPFTNWSGADGHGTLIKDGLIYNATDGYIYGIGKNGGSNGTPSMLRFDLASSDVKVYDLSFAPPEQQGDGRGYNQTESILLPNGDFYKFYIWKQDTNASIRNNQHSYYFHNDKVYAVAPMLTTVGRRRRFNAMNEGKGTLIDTGYTYGLYTELNVLHPYVSTVANLGGDAVNKRSDMTMTLTYKIREV